MQQIKDQAKQSQAEKLRKYGGEVRRAQGGSVKNHPDVKEDEALIRKNVKPEALRRADGGPVDGDVGPMLGRKRSKKNKGKGTNVNVIVADKPDAGGARCTPAGAPALPAAPPPPLPPRPPLPMPPRGGPVPGPVPGPGAGPMKKGGAVKKAVKQKK
jgi:hypothetical protein